MKEKVLAYITRGSGATAELLVFEHRDHAEAGLQVPAGGVERWEPIEAALAREIEEEAGLVGCRMVSQLAVVQDLGRTIRRHVYHVQAPAGTAEAWEHTVTGGAGDHGLVFRYRWVPLADVPPLAGGQDRWLRLLRAAFA
jgi:ADP-ribose pyrophosphatase YjhB (NUDIX family)